MTDHNPKHAAGSEATRRKRSTTVVLLGLIVLAAVLRLWRLGAWSFDSDEIFTLRDSLQPSLSNPRPLWYFLNHYLIRLGLPPTEFGLRVPPAVFGIFAIPVFYAVARRLVGTRAALFGAFLLVVSPLHVYYSQFARYWVLVFLLSTIYPFAIYLGLRDHRRGTIYFGLAIAVVAVLAHPASVLLFGGIGLWFALTHLRGSSLRELSKRRTVQGAALLGVVLLGAVAVRFVPLLEGWVDMHATGRNPSEFLLHLPGRPGLQQASFLLGYAESLTIPLVLTGLLGMYLLWRGRDRSLGLFLMCTFAFPIAFIVLVSFGAPVGVFYLVPAIPSLFLGAGVLLDRLAATDGELQPRWLLPAALTVIILAAGMPTLVSQYRDGHRYDLRGAAAWLGKHGAPGDIIVSDQFKVLAHYLPRSTVRRLRGEPADLIQAVHELPQVGSPYAVWVVMPAPAHAFRTSPMLGSLRGWIYDNCQLRNTIGAGRVDFRQYYLQIFRCVPVAET